jgi:hypothetical protein
MNFVRLTAEHAMSIANLEAVHSGFEITPQVAVDLESVGGIAGIRNGKVIGCAGVLPLWPGVGMAWAWLGREWRAEARKITGYIRGHLDEAEFHRIEAGVKVDYSKGHRWMRMLGFELETPVARKWGPDGGNYSIWVRVK